MARIQISNLVVNSITPITSKGSLHGLTDLASAKRVIGRNAQDTVYGSFVCKTYVFKNGSGGTICRI